MKAKTTETQKAVQDNPYFKIEVMASEHRLEKQITALELRMEQRFTGVEQKFTGVEQRFAQLSEKVDRKTNVIIGTMLTVFGLLIAYLQWKF